MSGKRLGKKHILTTPVEHHAVLHTALQLRDVYGFELELLPVDQFGMVDPQQLAHYLRPDTAFVSVIYANNEIGSINPVDEIAQVCRDAGIPFHTDAVQAAAHLRIRLDHIPIDLMSIGAHKFYGPKGVGCLFIRKGTELIPSQTGGSHEFNLRAGTPNLPYIVGMAEAFSLAQQESDHRSAILRPLRDQIIGRVLEEVPDARLTGHSQLRLPNHASFVFKGADGNLLLMLLDNAGFACSSGSACKTGDPEPSDVLLATGLKRDWALGSLRITLGAGNQPSQVDDLLAVLPSLVEKARE
jgi:cysteine desulfurase